MRKHIFTDTGVRPMPDLAPNWIGYTCVFCGHVSGLDAWQIKSMPPEMAYCAKSPDSASLWERFSGSVNCLGRPTSLCEGDK